MFRKKKSPRPEDVQPVPRGRAPAAKGASVERDTANNPLARRFQVESEPPTIDLAAPPRFHAAPSGRDDPKTAPLQPEVAPLSRFISHDPANGKFYVHPGDKGVTVTLQGETVVAPTELRRGDVIRMGNTEIQFRSCSP